MSNDLLNYNVSLEQESLKSNQRFLHANTTLLSSLFCSSKQKKDEKRTHSGQSATATATATACRNHQMDLIKAFLSKPTI